MSQTYSEKIKLLREYGQQLDEEPQIMIAFVILIFQLFSWLVVGYPMIAIDWTTMTLNIPFCMLCGATFIPALHLNETLNWIQLRSS